MREVKFTLSSSHRHCSARLLKSKQQDQPDQSWQPFRSHTYPPRTQPHTINRQLLPNLNLNNWMRGDLSLMICQSSFVIGNADQTPRRTVMESPAPERSITFNFGRKKRKKAKKQSAPQRNSFPPSFVFFGKPQAPQIELSPLP